ncbi:putative transcriptional regulator, Crp/Fnr family [Solidesulfovibrio fructosivorans JJ]]|uniref:Putative transcriptional regulator, Crp/Fnr family n=1 Tax=Solidesulfovibrio fructosivorans JJ] TaxID=596151 RepID=E1JW74_SOLFR|nr:cyclic nucleotide-binding domain-containing protein [Solidesulfovibrio fructosivorans]EFL51434.1 putative transcriptional regulator, Crp/Fnr family [Solidesulfovibrio fructosivorans JJ]]
MNEEQREAEIAAIAERLDGLKLAADFTAGEIRVLAAYVQESAFPAGTVVIQEGRKANSLAFMAEGVATIQKEDSNAPERHIIELGRDAVIGEIAFFDNEPRSATVVAKTDVRLLVLTRDQFDALAVEQPQLAIKVLFAVGRVLSHRLRQVTGRFVGLLA